MLRGLLTTSLLIGSLAIVARPADAQLMERKHEGFWISFGLGGGRNYNRNLDGGDLDGGAGYIRMGGTPSEQVLIGGEIIGWTREENGGTLSRGNVTFTIQFYPVRGSEFFIKGGIGGSSLQVSSSFGGTTVTSSENGAGETVGIGYDIRLGRNIYLTPNWDFLFQQVSSGGVTTHNTISLLTIGLTWH